MSRAIAVAVPLVVIAAILGPASGAQAAQCSRDQILAGQCDANIDAGIGNGGVDIGGSITAPGSDGGGTGGETSGPSAPEDPNADCVYLLNGRCLAAGPGRQGPVDPITLADIAHFRPDPGVDSMEPNGWMVVGLDTNFYASSGIQVHNGALLGQPASVRFTPVAWHWTYGDGTGRSSATPGATWAAHGLREFDATPTSHVYRAPGTYVIDLAIEYAPEYRFGNGPWLDVQGTITVPANRLTAVAGDADTVLVERECTVDPTGPGC